MSVPMTRRDGNGNGPADEQLDRSTLGRDDEDPGTENAPVLLQEAGAGAEGDQRGQSTVRTDVALLDALPKEQQELAVTSMLDQSRQWLDRALEATNPAREVAEFKAFVATVAEAAKQKKLSESIQLDAVEMVRRSDRALGVAIRKGQDAGEIIRNGQIGGTGRAEPGTRMSAPDDLVSPSTFFTNAQERAETYALTDGVSDEQFDAALTEAKEEGNLSRANVVRKVRNLAPITPINGYGKSQEYWDQVAHLATTGRTSGQILQIVGGYAQETTFRKNAREQNIEFPADKIVGHRRVDPLRVLENVVASVEANDSALALVTFEDVTPEMARDLLQRLAPGIKAIRRLTTELKEITHGTGSTQD